MPDNPALDHLAADVLRACVSVSRRVRFDASSLASHQFNALAWIESGITTAGQLAERERVSAPSMSRTICGLQERGLIARDEDPADGRKLTLRLTAEGRELLDQVRAERNAWLRDKLAGCTDAERAQLAAAASILQVVVDE